MFILRNDLNPDFSPTALSVITATADAETVKDILSFPFPMPMVSIEGPDEFAGFHAGDGPSYIKFSLDDIGNVSGINSYMNVGAGESKGMIRLFQGPTERQFEAISETTTLMASIQNSGKVEGNFTHHVCLSDRIDHGLPWHIELYDTNPEDVVLSVFSSNGSAVVPNEAFLEFLTSPAFDSMLNLRLRDPATVKVLERFNKEIRMPQHPLHQAFEATAIVLESNVVHAMTCLTPHRQNREIKEGRVFQKACLPKRHI